MYTLENNVQWTTNLKNAFKHNITKSSVIYEDDNQTQQTLTESDRIIDAELTEERYVPNMGIIGSACARKLELTIQNSDNLINLENKNLIFKIGAMYNNSTYYINYGNFIVYDAPQIDETNGKMKVVAYDYMKKFDKPYVDQVNYPCTLLQLLQNVCTQAGVTLGTTNFANKTFSVEDNQFEGETLRTVLQNIAKCAFSWARIGQDNKLYLDFTLTSSNTETLTIDDYKTNAFKKSKEYYGPVNQVTYADSDIEGQEERVKDQASIDANGLKELVIYDNLFAYTPEKRAALIQAGTRLLGLTYMPVSQLDAIGFIFLDCNDIINIETLDEQTYTTRVFSHTIKYTGVTSDSIITEGTSENEEAYKNTATTAFQNQQTKIMVDRANKQIKQLVTETTDHENRITQLQLDVDGITSEVSTMYNLTETGTGTRQITIENCLKGYILEMHIYGNNEVFKYLYPEDDLYPEDNLYPYGDSRITVTDGDGNSTTYDLRIMDVLRANDETYDEYILKDNYAKIIRRVNADGTTKITEQIEDIGTYTIYVSEGTNTIRIKNYYADFTVQCIVKNSYTDQFVPEIELGTKIIQNQESVRIAWNQISEAIQMMPIDGNASLAIIDENGNVLSSFDKSGQHFYDNTRRVFANMGVQTVIENQGTQNEQSLNYISFSVPVNYGGYTQQGMAWGVETPDKKFYPVLFIRDFHMAQQGASDFSGSLELNNCDIILSPGSGITNNSVKITAEPTGELTFISTTGDGETNLLTLYPEGHYQEQYSAVKILNKIWFFKNQAGTNSFRVGNTSQYALLTDEGEILATGDINVSGSFSLGLTGQAIGGTYHGGTLWGNTTVYGGNLTVLGDVICDYIYADNIGSDRRIKTDIKDCTANALDRIMKIEHKQFTKTTDNKHYDIGYIAQDMEKIDKNFVIINENSKDKLYYINELPIIATLTKAIQEQQAQIEELKQEIKSLKGE